MRFNETLNMDTQQYDTILFDFDGTLTHSLPVWLKAYQLALKSFGVDLSADEVMRECFYRPWDDIIAQYGLPSREQFSDRVKQGVEESFCEAELFDGVRKVLDDCQSLNLKLGIVTSSNRNVVSDFLQAEGLADYFRSVVTADDTTNFKPHPEPVFMALEELGSTPQKSLFIGDSFVDMLASESAGCDRALFFPDEHHAFYCLEELRAYNPSFVFHNYCELWTNLPGFRFV